MLKAGDKEKIQSAGFSMLDMQRFAHSLQYQAEGYRIADINQLKKLTVPVIALIETSSGYSHFVVVRRITDNTYIFPTQSGGIADFLWKRSSKRGIT
jgi:predicted double-glycine peptidase